MAAAPPVGQQFRRLVDQMKPLGLVPAVDRIDVVAEDVGGLEIPRVKRIPLLVGPLAEVRVEVAGHRHEHRPLRIGGFDFPVFRQDGLGFSTWFVAWRR